MSIIFMEQGDNGPGRSGVLSGDLAMSGALQGGRPGSGPHRCGCVPSCRSRCGRVRSGTGLSRCTSGTGSTRRICRPSSSDGSRLACPPRSFPMAVSHQLDARPSMTLSRRRDSHRWLVCRGRMWPACTGHSSRAHGNARRGLRRGGPGASSSSAGHVLSFTGGPPGRLLGSPRPVGGSGSRPSPAATAPRGPGIHGPAALDPELGGPGP